MTNRITRVFVLLLLGLLPAHYAQAQDIPGDGSTTARLMVPGTFDSDIDSASDQDGFLVGLISGSTYQIDAEATSGTLDTRIGLFPPGQLNFQGCTFSSAGVLVANDDINFPGNINSRITHTATQTGDHLLCVRPVTAATGNYRLTAAVTTEPLAAQVPDIPGDGTTTGRLFAPGIFSSDIASATDQDVLRVRLISGGAYQIDAAATSDTLDPRIALYPPGQSAFGDCTGSAGVLVANDDIEAGVNTNSRIIHTATQTGDHLLCADGAGATTGNYRLTATVTSAPPTQPRATISAPDTFITIAETALNGTTLTVTLENTEYETSPTAGQFTLNLSAGTGVTVSNVARDSATAATLTLAYGGSGIDANTRIGVTVAGAAHTSAGDLTTDNMLRVVATAPSFAGMQPIANQTYLANSAITDLTLPAASGGEGTLSYTLAPTGGGGLPNGLTFDADTRVLSGTPDTEQAATGYTYTVTAGDGNTATLGFTIEVLSPATGLTAVRDLVATERRGRVVRIALTWLPPATVPAGTSVSSYEIQGCSAADTDCVVLTTVNHHVDVDAEDDSQSATLFRVTFNFYRVRARTAAGVSPWANVALTVDPGVVVDPGNLPSMVQNLVSSALADNSVTLTWEAPTDAVSTAVNRYVVVRGFPAETATLGAFAPPGAEAVVTLADDVFTYADSGLLPGTEYLYEVFASSNAGDGEVAQLLVTTTGTLTTSIAGVATGAITEGATDSITGTLTITTTSGNSEFVAPVNSDGEEQLQFSTYGMFTISAAGDWTYSLNYNLPRVRALTAGQMEQDMFTVTAAAPTADGVAVTQVVTITITGVNTRPFAAIRLVEGSTVAAGETLRLESDITDPDNELDDLTIAWTAAGGIGTFSAAASADTDWMVPAATPPAEYLLTLTVTDPGSASDTEQVSITVTPPLPLEFGGETIDDQTYTMGAAITDLTLPVATGGTGPYSYALSGMPSGLAFDSGTRVLSGAPNAVQAATTYTYTATDAASPPGTGTLAFTIEVAAPAPIPILTIAAPTGEDTDTLAFTVSNTGEAAAANTVTFSVYRTEQPVNAAQADTAANTAPLCSVTESTNTQPCAVEQDTAITAEIVATTGTYDGTAAINPPADATDYFYFVCVTTSAGVRTCSPSGDVVNVLPAATATISATNPSPLTEANLSGATLTVTLAGTATYLDPLPADSITLNSAATDAGVTVMTAVRDSATEATLTLAFDRAVSDFDTDLDIIVTVADAAHAGTGDLDTGTVTVTAIDEDDIPGDGSTTTRLAVPGTFDSIIDPDSDQDGFLVALVSGGAYQFDAERTGGSTLDTSLGLYPPGQADFGGLDCHNGSDVLAGNDDFGGDTNSRITHTATQTGDHLLCVDAFGTNRGSGDYRVTAAVTSEPPAADDATLSALTLSGGATLTPVFDAGTLTYTADVANSVANIMVTPTAADAGATITVNGTAVTSSMASGSITLNVGSNLILVEVTAADGSTMTYAVTVARMVMPGGNGAEVFSASVLTEANLNGAILRVGLGGVSFVAAGSLNAAQFTLSTTVPGVTVNAVSRGGGLSADLTLAYDGTDFDVDAPLIVTITAAALTGTEDLNTNALTVTAVVENNNANLSALTLSAGTLTPDFDAATTTYAAMVDNSVSSLTLTPTVANAFATITVAGTAVASGMASGSVDLDEGPNAIVVEVTATDGSTMLTYTVTVTRAAAPTTTAAISATVPDPLTEANLDGATLTVTLTDTTYMDPLPANPVTLNTDATDAGVTVMTAVRDTATVATVTLDYDDTDFDTDLDIIVTVAAAAHVGSGDLLTAARTVTAIDETSRLSALSLSEGALDPVFNAGTFVYAASVANSIDGLTVTPAAAAGTTITVDGAPVNSGEASAELALTVGANTITVAVTTPKATAQDYTLTVTREMALSFGGADTGGVTEDTATTTATGTLTVTNPNPSGGTEVVAQTDADGTYGTFTIVAASGAWTYTLNNSAPATNALAASETVTDVFTVVAAADPGAITDVTITITGANDAPTADAGPPQAVALSATVTLDGSASADPDTGADPGNADAIDSYAWTQTDSSGNTVTLDDATAVSPTFTAPSVPTTLEFSLVVNDGDADSAPATVTITVTGAPAATISATTPDPLTEANLDGATLTVTLTNTTYGNPLPADPITLDTAATTAGVTATAVRDSATEATLTLAFDRAASDFDTDLDITVTVAAAAHANAGDLDAGTVTATAIDESDVATLSALTLSGGVSLNETFDAGTFTYTADVDNSVANIMVTPTATDDGATIEVQGTAVTSGSASTAITLTAGMATDIDVLVTAEDGSTTRTYNLAVTRAAALALSFGGETIDAQTYTVNTAIAGLTLPVAGGGTAPYSYALSDVPSGLTFAAATRVLSGTPNAVQAATTYTYTATDAAVSPASVMLDLVITVNAVVVPTATISATTPATLTEANLDGATLTVTLTNTTYGNPLPADPITLDTAATTAGVTATAVRDSATEATLTLAFDRAASDFDTDLDITVTVAAAAHANAGDLDAGTVTATAIDESDVATLSALTLSGGATLTPVFDAGTFTYTADVDNSVANIMVTPTATDAGATIEVQGTAVTSGAASTAITLTAGVATDIAVLVTAEDGTTQTYNLAVTRAAATTPTAAIATPSSLTEATLDGATVTVMLTNTEYVPGVLATNLFTVTLSGSGVTVSTAARTSAVLATLTLAYGGTGIDANTTLGITVLDAAHSGTGNLDTATIPVTATPPSLPGATFSVAENAAANTPVGTPLVPDNFPGGSQTWAIVSGNTGNDFAINPSTGQLTVAANDSINFEDTPSYTLMVSLTVGTTAMAQAAVTVTVSDVDEPPAAPAAPTVAPAAESLNVSWTAPANNGPAITRYDVQFRTGSDPFALASPGPGAATSLTITGLTANTAYEVQVRAANAEGDGAYSASGSGTPLAAGAPTATITTTAPTTLTEANLNGAMLTVTLTNATYVGTLTDSQFTLTGAPGTAMISVASVTGSGTQAVLVLAYPDAGADLDSDLNLSVVVDAAAHTGTNPLTTGAVAVADNAAPVISDPGLQSYVQNVLITPLMITVDDADGDAAGNPPTVTLTNLPNGLVFDGTNQVTGTPTELGDTVVTITAADGVNDMVTETFTITVTPSTGALRFGVALIPAQSYTVNTAITDLTLPAATGGTGPYGYSLSGMPSGLSFNAMTRVLSGTPDTEEGARAYTYTAVDSAISPAAVTLSLVITVNAPSTTLRFDVTTIPAQSYTVNAAITDLTLPAATGGTGTLSYTLSGMPSGLIFDAGTRVLSGTPDTEQMATTYTYTATDVTSPPAAVMLSLVITVRLEATGGPLEVARSEAMEMTLGAFGRSFTSSAVDVLGERFSSGVGGSQLTFGGRTLSLESLTNDQAAAGAEPDNQPVPAAAGGQQTSVGALFAGSAFQLSLNEGDAAGVGATTLWARGAVGNYEGEPEDGFQLDGDIVSGYLGLDYRASRRTLVGVAVSHSRGDADFSSAAIADGEVETELTSILPYVQWQPHAGLSLWGLVGYGLGESEITDSGASRKTDVEMQTAALGARGKLWSGGRADVALKASALTVEIESDSEQNLSSVTTRAHRLRMALAGNRHGAASARGGRFGQRFELGLRWDLGDVETGAGADLGAGVEYANPRSGTRLRLDGHYLLVHEESDFEAWEVSAEVGITPSLWGRGVRFALEPGWDSAGARQRMVMDFTDVLGPAWRGDGLKLELYGEHAEDHEFGLEGSFHY